MKSWDNMRKSRSSNIYIETIIKIFNDYFSEAICDPVISDDLADHILSPESSNRRDLLFKLFESEKFDAVLTFSAGMGNEVR